VGREVAADALDRALDTYALEVVGAHAHEAHTRAWRIVGVLLTVVRYAARVVLLGGPTPSKDRNGSLASVCGDAAGRVRAVRLAEADARRERVLWNVDFVLRFGGDGGSMGRVGSVVVGFASRSLRSRSTSSTAVRVRVRLCVGAEKR
jgi:hypothetical protein